jgi:hypothetical protein
LFFVDVFEDIMMTLCTVAAFFFWSSSPTKSNQPRYKAFIWWWGGRQNRHGTDLLKQQANAQADGWWRASKELVFCVINRGAEAGHLMNMMVVTSQCALFALWVAAGATGALSAHLDAGNELSSAPAHSVTASSGREHVRLNVLPDIAHRTLVGPHALDASLDCAMRNFSWSFALSLLPSRAPLMSVFDALRLSIDCNATRPVEPTDNDSNTGTHTPHDHAISR